jgi:hypothetical protein
MASLFAAAGVASAFVAAQPAQAFGSGSIINANVFNADLRLCLAPDGFGQGAVVTQVQCNGLAGQAWTPVLLDGSSHFEFVSVANGRCLDVAGGRPLDHATVITNTCNGAGSQRWTVQAAGYGVAAELRNGAAGSNTHCLDVPGGSLSPVAMQIFTCNNSGAQRWFF